MTLSGKQFKYALLSGVNGIRNDANRIDALNVFPVPDGDTGSNMSATAKYAAEKIEQLKDNCSISEVANTFARGMLLGARGNSGVILSRIFKGFSESLKDKDIATSFDIIGAFNQSKELAYKSVMEPIEGTILTVIKDISTHLKKTVTLSMSISEVFSIAAETAYKSVQNTPNLLPVLKEVGVVDSGGEGLFKFLEAFSNHLKGKPTKVSKENSLKIDEPTKRISHNGEFGYCTEFIINLKYPKHFKKERFTEYIEKLGNSIVAVRDDNIFKIHIHSIKPGRVLTFAQKFGSFFKIKIDNMSEQVFENQGAKYNHTDTLSVPKKKNISVVSCNVGQGIINDMKDYGADFIIEGGQTMNPSAADIIQAINLVDSNKVIILPNNSNIILAAQQAAQTITDKKVLVIPTKTQMQGIAAIINFNTETSLEENKQEMINIIKDVSTVKVTRSSKTTKIKGVKVSKGEFLSIADTNILGSFKSSVEAACKALKTLINEETEVVTIYYGDDSTTVDASEVSSFIENNYDNIEFEVKSGNQPIYNFLIAVE